jgi:hypothetical protein
LISRSLYKTHADYAHRRLCAFIEQARILYGTEFIVYNVHGLTHISEDVKRFGPLDEHSAFPFENFLGHLKMLLRKPQFPLQQIIRRVIERQGIVTRQTPKTIIPQHSTEGALSWTCPIRILTVFAISEHIFKQTFFLYFEQ